MNLCDCGTIKRIMESHGMGFRKDLGQNFLISSEIPYRCAEGCEADPNTLILEIGPGIGCMTDELAARFRHVVAVEIDDRLIPVLAETMAEHDNVTVHHGDVMKTDIAALLKKVKEENGLPEDIRVAVCANLPYYITTPILMYLVESGIPFSSITVMVQLEVADRLTAKAGSDAYGAISAVLAYYGEARRLFTVPSGCFMPRPKVNSAVVRLSIYPEKPFTPKSEKILFRVIRGAFEQRRKTLVNALSSCFSSVSKEEIGEILVNMGLNPQIRGERLTIENFVDLSNALYEKMEG